MWGSQFALLRGMAACSGAAGPWRSSPARGRMSWHRISNAAQDSAALSRPHATVLDTPAQAMPRGGVAFYNCGPQSGRSQPHKHLQVGAQALPRGRACA